MVGLLGVVVALLWMYVTLKRTGDPGGYVISFSLHTALSDSNRAFAVGVIV